MSTFPTTQSLYPWIQHPTTHTFIPNKECSVKLPWEMDTSCKMQDAGASLIIKQLERWCTWLYAILHSQSILAKPDTLNNRYMNTCGFLTQQDSIAESSYWSFLQYYWSALNSYLSKQTTIHKCNCIFNCLVFRGSIILIVARYM